MEAFSVFPGKTSDGIDVRLLWKMTHKLLHNVTNLNSPQRLRGFCVDGGSGCVCLEEIGS